MTLIKHTGGWIKAHWPSIRIALLGVLLMLGSKLAESIVEELWPQHGEWIGYFLEHLGAVLVVGMLVRVAIEEGYQETFLGSVKEEVKKKIQDGIDQISKESLQPITNQLLHAKEDINQLDSSIQQLATALTYKITQNLDQDLRRVLEDGVLNSPFVRPEYSLNLKLQPFSNRDGSPSDILEVSVTTSYKVTNRSDERAKYLCESWLDDDIRPSGIRESQFTRFVFGKVGSDNKTHFLPVADILALEDDGKIFEHNGALHLKYEIEGIEKGSTYEVIVAGKQLMHRNDIFVWNVVTLTNKIDVTVQLTGGITQKDLDIFPRAIHHAAEQAAIDKTTDPTKVTMNLHQVFLPYQGVEVRWSPHVERKSSPGKLPQAPITTPS
ncbi:MAG TPA: hypothetical protein VG759_05570 [Candidatus Angelobacter sp.]|jgi:hypothetical protein|nr:hypothetical protein [Candidatus Angelobacter sp.]